MYSDKAVQFLLLPNRWAGPLDKDAGANIVSNCGEHSLYEVVTLPIYGQLDSYGRLENIVKDANTEILENYYKKTIEVIAEHSSSMACHKEAPPEDGDQPSTPEVPGAGCFINGEIYEQMTKLENTVSECGTPLSVWYEGYMTAKMLEELEFTYMGEVLDSPTYDPKRYKHKWVSNHAPDLIGYSDGRWTQFTIKDKAQAIYHPAGFYAVFYNTYNREYPVDAEWMKTTSVHGLSYEEAVQDILKGKELEKQFDTPEHKAITRRFNRLRGSVSELTLSRSALNSHFLDIYEEHLGDLDIRNEYVKVKHFNHNMFANNRLYMPTFNGYQHGNRQAEVILHNETLKIIQRKIAERSC